MFRSLILPCSIWVLLFLPGSICLGQQNVLDTPVNIPARTTSASQWLEIITQQTGIIFSYSPKRLNLKRSIRFSASRQRVEEILNALFPDNSVRFIQKKNKILLRPEKKSSSRPPPSKAPRLSRVYTISGYVRDAESGEVLIGASVHVPVLRTGVYTNVYGFFSLTLPQGKHAIKVSFAGYSSQEQPIELRKNTRLDMQLASGYELDEVIISAKEADKTEALGKIASHEIPIEKIKKLPVLLGERDVVKTMQLMPGVQTISTSTNGLHVRGGGPDQNLMLLDGVPIYNPTHALGFISVFYGNAINRAEIIKGDFSAHYGGRLSSVIDIRMKEGNTKQWHGELGIGLLSGNFNLEGPIIKDKTSIYISGRRSWLDAILSPIQNLSQDKETRSFFSYRFYDTVAKINHKISDNDRLYLSGYWGNDAFDMEDRLAGFGPQELANSLQEVNLLWGNRMATARWNHIWSPRLFTNLTATFTRYRYSYEDLFISDEKRLDPANLQEDYYAAASLIEDLGLKLDGNYYLNPRHTFSFGATYSIQRFNPAVQSFTTGFAASGDTLATRNELTAAQYGVLYAEHRGKIGKQFRITTGLRLASFKVENQLYLTLQPRFTAQWVMDSLNILKFSYSRVNQFIHLLTNSDLGLPNDLWVHSTGRIKPSAADHLSIGYATSFSRGLTLSLDAYYKHMNNLLEYEGGANSLNLEDKSESWEDRVVVGKGWSYGLEVLLEKTEGKTTGWLGYTLSWAYRQFDDINDGEVFPFRFDRRHDIGLAVTHRFSKKMDVGLVWAYGSGSPVTLAVERYLSTDYLLGQPDLPVYTQVFHVDTRNNYRLRAVHRLDLAINFTKVKKIGVRVWSFGMYNVYGRKNPTSIFLDSFQNPGVVTLREQSLLPRFVPYAAWRFRF